MLPLPYLIAAGMAVVSFALLVYVYYGYRVVLRLVSTIYQHTDGQPATHTELPRITVLLTVFNEQQSICRRIDNVLSCDYARDRLELLVASDGSTDDTDNLVLGVTDPRVRLFRLDRAQGAGKSQTQNAALCTINSDVVVFTDADTKFSRHFLREIAAPFANPEVGAVDGHLFFHKTGDPGLGESQGFYWRYELDLRQLEDQLGILAVMSGACMAVRRTLVKTLPADVGEDCVIPLDVVQQGYRVVHARKAIAYDWMAGSHQMELRVRIRMTLRNWKGTWMYAPLLNPLRHPGYAFALWSHKILRWLSPFMLITLSLASFFLMGNGLWLTIPGFAVLAFYLLGLFGWLAAKTSYSIPLASTVFSFLLANLGFFLGVLKALRGDKITRYHNAGRQEPDECRRKVQ